MNDEQNQSIRFSRLMSDSRSDSFETSSSQFLVGRKIEDKTSKRNRLLIGLGILVILILIVQWYHCNRLIAVIVSSQNNSMKKENNQNNSSLDVTSTFTTAIPAFNSSHIINNGASGTKISPSPSIQSNISLSQQTQNNACPFNNQQMSYRIKLNLIIDFQFLSLMKFENMRIR